MRRLFNTYRLCFSVGWELLECLKQLLLDGVASVDLELEHVFASEGSRRLEIK